MAEHELSPEQLRAIFDARVAPALDRPPQQQPTLVILGGQPGAGKTVAQRLALRDHPDAGVVDADELRRFHPGFYALMAQRPLRMPELTNPAAGAWYAMSVEHLRSRRADVVMETTLRQPDALARTIEGFREAGYAVELAVVAVPPAVSRLGMISRYAEQHRSEGAGRWTPMGIHDEAVRNGPVALENALVSGRVDRVAVINRGGHELYAAEDVAGGADRGDRQGR